MLHLKIVTEARGIPLMFNLSIFIFLYYFVLMVFMLKKNKRISINLLCNLLPIL